MRNGSNTSGRRPVVIISAIASPAGGDTVIPSMEYPVATVALRKGPAQSRIGRPSTVNGRSPAHGSS